MSDRIPHAADAGSPPPVLSTALAASVQYHHTAYATDKMSVMSRRSGALPLLSSSLAHAELQTTEASSIYLPVSFTPQP